MRQPPHPDGSARPKRGRQLPPGMVEALSTQWDVGEWRSAKRAEKGRANITLVVETDRGRYALRSSNFRKTEAGLHFELSLLEHLRAVGYPAPRIVPTRSGDLYTAGMDGSFCVMTEWIAGEHFDGANHAHLLEAGRWLGRYHQAVSGFAPRFSTEVKVRFEVAAAEGPNAVAAVAGVAEEVAGPESRKRLAVAIDALAGAFEAIPDAVPAGLAECVIQGSYGGSAVLFDGNDLCAVLDFDRATWEWRTLDLAYSAKSFARDRVDRTGGASMDPVCCRAYLEAYLSEQPLPVSELEALPAVMAAQRLIKVAVKAGNLARKHNTRLRQTERDVDKFASVLEHEARMLGWLRQWGTELLPAAV